MQTKIPLFPQRKKAFTLVELIIVITILAILATIAFVSFQGYSAQSRDSNRATTTKGIENGVSIFQVKSGKIPDPDSIFATGEMSGTTLNTVGYVGENIMRQINLSEVPKDPKTGKQYEYGVDVMRRYFQVGMTLEDATARLPGMSLTYAESGKQTAGVIGNYEYPLLYSGSLYPLPSLLFTGAKVFSSTGTCFVVDKGQNTFENTGTGCAQSVAETLALVAGTGGVSFDPVVADCDNLGDYDWNSLYGVTKEELSVKLKCKQTLNGGNCATQPNYVHADYVKGNPTSANQSRQNSNASSPCYYSCIGGYSGSDCSILLTVGQTIASSGSETAQYVGVFQGRTLWLAGTGSAKIEWKSTNTTTVNAENEMDGRNNTGTFNSSHGASNYCQNLVWAGFNDWYLPAMTKSDGTNVNCSSASGEMQFIYCKHKGTESQSLLGFSALWYWSSTQVISTDSSFIDFSNGAQYNGTKTYQNYARCIRVAN